MMGRMEKLRKEAREKIPWLPSFFTATSIDDEKVMGWIKSEGELTLLHHLCEKNTRSYFISRYIKKFAEKASKENKPRRIYLSQPSIPVNKHPFTIDKMNIYTCAHRFNGVKKLPAEKRKRKLRRDYTEKVDCPAKIVARRLTIYEGYLLSLNMTLSDKRNTIRELKAQLKADPDVIPCSNWIFISLPLMPAHREHTIPEPYVIPSDHRIQDEEPEDETYSQPKNDISSSITNSSFSSDSCPSDSTILSNNDDILESPASNALNTTESSPAKHVQLQTPSKSITRSNQSSSILLNTPKRELTGSIKKPSKNHHLSTPRNSSSKAQKVHHLSTPTSSSSKSQKTHHLSTPSSSSASKLIHHSTPKITKPFLLSETPKKVKETLPSRLKDDICVRVEGEVEISSTFKEEDNSPFKDYSFSNTELIEDYKAHDLTLPESQIEIDKNSQSILLPDNLENIMSEVDIAANIIANENAIASERLETAIQEEKIVIRASMGSTAPVEQFSYDDSAVFKDGLDDDNKPKYTVLEVSEFNDEITLVQQAPIIPVSLKEIKQKPEVGYDHPIHSRTIITESKPNEKNLRISTMNVHACMDTLKKIKEMLPVIMHRKNRLPGEDEQIIKDLASCRTSLNQLCKRISKLKTDSYVNENQRLQEVYFNKLKLLQQYRRQQTVRPPYIKIKPRNIDNSNSR